MSANQPASPAATTEPPPQKEIDRLFAAVMKTGASDLHLKAGSPPLFRIQGQVVRAKSPPLSADQVRQLIKDLIGPKQDKDIEERGAADFAYGVRGVGRFRVNIFRQRGALSLAARRVQTDIPTLDQLNLPPGVKVLPTFDQGLVLVAGVTGSGKSTTLAAVIHVINQTQPVHIVTIEDPIEYLYHDEKGFVNQREIGIDVPNFSDGLRSALREDPDVVLVGEMRDAETIETALMAAETGHLVFGTIHSGSAPQTVGRVLDYFPPDRHYQIRQLLFFNLRAVMVQKLLRGARPQIARVPAVELMICNPAIKKLIFDGEDQKIADVVRTGKQEGMQDMNQSLVDLVHRGLITEQVALENSLNPEQLAMNLKGIVLGSDRGSIIGS
ncbi:MAG: type IV pilus twitching motility protein PilT [Planctomycetes bacterium]|nr:type IV pilus twitching motility protein PilT [Planctomycetota bacterium]